MLTRPLKHAKIFVWDLDNVLYRYDEAFHRNCKDAAVAAVLKLAPEKSIDAVRLTISSRTGSALQSVVKILGGDPACVHRVYHELVSADSLKPNGFLIDRFRRASAAGVTHVILTHGSTDWAKRVLRARGLECFFKPEHIWGHELLGFHRKDKSPYPFEYVLKKTGFSAQDAVMIEDTPENLYYPRVMGMKTVLLSYGENVRTQHADHVYVDAMDFLTAYCHQHARPSGRGIS